MSIEYVQITYLLCHVQVEVFRHTIANHTLVGTYSVLNNSGGLVHPATTKQDMDELASLLQIPIAVSLYSEIQVYFLPGTGGYSDIQCYFLPGTGGYSEIQVYFLPGTGGYSEILGFCLLVNFVIN